MSTRAVTDSLALGAEAEAFKHGAIGEHEQRGRFMVRPGGIVVMLCHERVS